MESDGWAECPSDVCLAPYSGDDVLYIYMCV